jgi:hypothetical protein
MMSTLPNNRRSVNLGRKLKKVETRLDLGPFVRVSKDKKNQHRAAARLQEQVLTYTEPYTKNKREYTHELNQVLQH